MSVDLRLLIFDHDEGERLSFSHTQMELGADYDLHDKIKSLPSMPVPKGFTSYSGKASDGETGYGETQEDCYGERVKWILSDDLLKIDVSDCAPKVKAAWAYIACLPPETKIALFWH